MAPRKKSKSHTGKVVGAAAGAAGTAATVGITATAGVAFAGSAFALPIVAPALLVGALIGSFFDE